MPNWKKEITNKRMSALFFVFFILFFILFASNLYTMNVIMSFFCLQLSLAFKTWQLIRGDEH